MKFTLAPLFLTPFLLAACLAVAATAQGGVWDDLVRRTSKASEALPERIPGADDIGRRLNRHPETRGIAAREAGDAAKLSDSRAVSRVIDTYLGAPSPDLIKAIERLDPAQLPQAIVLSRGAKRLTDGVGDAAASARFVREGGADLAAAVGLHGDDVVDEAIRLDALLRSGNLTIPEGYRRPTLQDFGRMIVDGGEASWKFYTTYVRPHWKEWAAGGAIAVFLVKPELFYDAAGRLTEAGAEAITRTAGEALAGTLRGVGVGSGDAAKAIGSAVERHFLRGWSSIPSYFGIALLVLIIGFCFRRTRQQLLRPFRWVNGQ